MDHRKRFVAQAEAGHGWRIWDKQQKRWWGPVLPRQPEAVLTELNGPKRPEKLVELMRSATR
jgi:hypothetical protein